VRAETVRRVGFRRGAEESNGNRLTWSSLQESMQFQSLLPSEVIGAFLSRYSLVGALSNMVDCELLTIRRPQPHAIQRWM
jgi:hypothetical protein